MFILRCLMQTTSKRQSLPGGWQLHDLDSNISGCMTGYLISLHSCTSYISLVIATDLGCLLTNRVYKGYNNMNMLKMGVVFEQQTYLNKFRAGAKPTKAI